MRKLLPLRSSVHQAGFSNTEYQRAEEIVNTLNKASSRQDLTPLFFMKLKKSYVKRITDDK